MPQRTRVPAALAEPGAMAINHVGKPGLGAFNKPPVCEEEPSMKLVLTLLGVVLLVVAAVYFVLPADQLPGFFPGHEDGVTRMHTKHGMVAGVAGLVLLAAGVWVGRRGGGRPARPLRRRGGAVGG